MEEAPAPHIEEHWMDAVAALGKTLAKYKDCAAQLVNELQRHGYQGGGIAIDIGSAEGSFTEVWLALLKQQNMELPREVHLVEPVAERGRQGLETLQKRFRGSPDFELHTGPFSEDFSWPPMDEAAPVLVVASHVTYYEKDPFNLIEWVLDQFAVRKGVRCLLWVVVRDRDCGFYRWRSAVLAHARAIPEAAEPHSFSDYLIFRLRQEGRLFTKRGRRFLLTPDKDETNARKQIGYLAHLPADLSWGMPRSQDLEFSETHLFIPAHRPALRGGRTEGRDDPRSQHAALFLKAHDILSRHKFLLRHIELATIVFDKNPEIAKLVTGSSYLLPASGSLQLFFYRPANKSPVAVQVAEALKEYLDAFPSFLLYDAFYSPFPPRVSSFRHGYLVERIPAETGRDDFRYPDLCGGVEEESLKISAGKRVEITFDVAWRAWGDSLRKTLAGDSLEAGKGHGFYFAVPARLSDEQQQDGASRRLRDAAGMFVCADYDGDPEHEAYDLHVAYERLRSVLQSSLAERLLRERETAEQRAATAEDKLKRAVGPILSTSHTVKKLSDALQKLVLTVVPLRDYESDDLFFAAARLATLYFPERKSSADDALVMFHKVNGYLDHEKRHDGNARKVFESLVTKLYGLLEAPDGAKPLPPSSRLLQRILQGMEKGLAAGAGASALTEAIAQAKALSKQGVLVKYFFKDHTDCAAFRPKSQPGAGEHFLEFLLSLDALRERAAEKPWPRFDLVFDGRHPFIEIALPDPTVGESFDPSNLLRCIPQALLDENSHDETKPIAKALRGLMYACGCFDSISEAVEGGGFIEAVGGTLKLRVAGAFIRQEHHLD